MSQGCLKLSWTTTECIEYRASDKKLKVYVQEVLSRLSGASFPCGRDLLQKISLGSQMYFVQCTAVYSYTALQLYIVNIYLSFNPPKGNQRWHNTKCSFFKINAQYELNHISWQHFLKHDLLRYMVSLLKTHLWNSYLLSRL